MSCVFCQIIEGKLPANVVYEDDLVIAFLDIFPINPGHVLIVPRVHAELLSALPEETAGRMFRVAQKVEKAIRATSVRCEGTNLVLNNGGAAGQEVPHAHLHIVPRFDGDGIRFHFSQKKGAPDELKERTREIREALKL